MACCMCDSIEVPKKLIEYGFDLNERCPKSGGTPLHICCKRGKVRLCEMLLRNGADPDIRDDEGKCPMDMLSKKTTKVSRKRKK